MKKRKCSICGFSATSDEPPASCPVCGVDKKFFEDVEDAPTDSDGEKPE